ncbi:uncharacterized protein ACA1_381090 [Acanthamoeba castellanii str. Neff]|uniref:Uncharacterized protein n=1 Tax=Acanthamoeba castellanii (strain ATCC 30010 / Neff) TaxID=1257118 RepID=L8GN60_ACACF|nr:uncharacterized protein ACA1_381090 [Acanthamoeba castellanii str. Neff]ELR14422.1 hypothetical protein ACA1_381090 [Acanthamoeba castellanii str. Neff]
MQDAELAKRKKRCYDLVVQLDELEGQQRVQDEHLQKIKRQKTDLHTEFENEKRSFVEEWAKAEAATNRDAEIDRAERAWNEWVSYAKAHPSEARQAVVEVAENNAHPPSDSAAAAATDTNEEGIPVPQLQERAQVAEPPRLRSTRRSRRSFSLTSPTAPSTPVRKKLEWDENAAHNEGSDASELMPSPGGPPSSASSSPASTTTAGGAADSSAAPVLCKLPTPVRGRSTSPAAASAGATTAATAPPSRKELIDELLNPSPSSSSSSPVPQVVVSAPPSSANSARVLFEE